MDRTKRNKFLVLYLCLSIFTANCRAQDPCDEIVVREAAKLLVERSYRKNIDQIELTRNWVRNFMRVFDPKRMHFLASDEEELLRVGTHAYEDAQNGNPSFAADVAKRFCKRLAPNATAIQQFLSDPHDFTVDESMPLAYLSYAETEAVSRERWRRQIKYELLLETTHNSDFSDARNFLIERYRTIQLHFEGLDRSKILSLYIDALAQSIDPHTRYFDPETLTSFRTSHIPTITLGLGLDFKKGDLWIRSVEKNANRKLIGTRIVAVRLEGKEPIHISGLTPHAAYQTLTSPIGNLGFANRVIIDADDPRTGARFEVRLER